MADKVPIRGAYDGSNALTGLANFVSNETIGVAHGGTGIATVGANQLVTGNGTSAITSESNLTFDGSTLLVSGTDSATSIMAADSGAALSSQNAKHIILVDLTDPATMWDVQAFLARARYTSWYQELGPPPMRGALFINNAGTSLIWWNLDTDAAYMSFTPAAEDIMRPGSVGNKVVFLDGFIYVADGGGGSGRQANIIDLLSDKAWSYSTGGQNVFDNDLENRNNGTNGYMGFRTSPTIINNTVNGFAAVRDPLLYDEFDRPIHWWAIITAAYGASGRLVCVYNPIDDAIYDGGHLGSSTTTSTQSIAIAPNGAMAWAADLGNKDYFMWIPSIYSISVDGWEFYNMYLTPGSGTNNHPFTSSYTAADVDIYNSNSTDIVAWAGNEGLLLAYPRNSNSVNNKGAVRAITSTYNTPYMKGSRVGAYPLNDATDRSGAGNNLSNGTAPAYTGTGPFGDCADFNGSNQYLLSGTFTTINSQHISVSLYFNADSNNPSATEILASISNSNQGESYTLGLTSSNGYLYWAWDDGSAGSGNVTSATDACDGKWHHVYVTRGPAVGALNKIYLDGVLIASGGAGTNQGTVDVDRVSLGGRVDGSEVFDGKMAQVSISCDANGESWTENEISMEYQRMVRALGGATVTLANSNVKSVSIDQHTGLASLTTAANQTEIWDIETGMRESIDATTTATIADADVRLKSGAILPEYITGRSGAIEFDGQERNVLG